MKPRNLCPVNNNLCWKLVPSLESLITFDQIFQVTSASGFILDFNLLICGLDNFTFKVSYWVILYWYYIKVKEIYNTPTVPCEKSKMVYFASSKNEKNCCISILIYISSKINLLYCFQITIKFLLFAKIYCYHIIIFFGAKISYGQPVV